MKVVVISATFPPMQSGGGEYAVQLCRRLAESGLDVHVVVPAGVAAAGALPFHVYPVMERWNWAELPRLLQVVRRCRPDIVNIHFTGEIYRHQPMITLLPSVLKRVFRNVSVVTLIEYPTPANLDLVPWWTRLVRKGILWWVGSNQVAWGYGTLLRDSDRLIVLSEHHQHILEPHLATVRAKTTVIAPPPLLQLCSEEPALARRRGRELLGITPDDWLMAYYGYLYPGKGIETLLDALAIVSRQVPRLSLVLVGGSNEIILRSMGRPHYVEELEARCARLGIVDKVKFTGYYSSESDSGSRYLMAADFCVLPFDEGVMMHRSSIAAAVAHGLPIVTTRGQILESPFGNGHDVLLCQPRDPASLAAAITVMVGDPGLRDRLRDGSARLARDWYSWERTIAGTVDVFRRSTIDRACRPLTAR